MITKKRELNKTSEKKEVLLAVIDMIHHSAHNGGFDNAGEEVIDSLTNFFRSFLDVNVTMEQASKILNKNKTVIRNNIYRKAPKGSGMKHYWAIRLNTLLECFKKEPEN